MLWAKDSFQSAQYQTMHTDGIGPLPVGMHQHGSAAVLQVSEVPLICHILKLSTKSTEADDQPFEVDIINKLQSCKASVVSKAMENRKNQNLAGSLFCALVWIWCHIEEVIGGIHTDSGDR